MTVENRDNVDTTPFTQIEDDRCEEKSNKFLNSLKATSLAIGLLFGCCFEAQWATHLAILAKFGTQGTLTDFLSSLFNLTCLPLVLQTLRSLYTSVVHLASPGISSELSDQLFLHIQSRFAVGVLSGVLLTLSLADLSLSLKHHLFYVAIVLTILAVWFRVEKRVFDERKTILMIAERENEHQVPTVSVV